MAFAPIQGVDYSRGIPPGSAALKADGKLFACRYLADDDRGIFGPEYQELKSGEVGVVAVFETSGDANQFSGWNQGATDATWAQDKLIRTGLPPTMPIYFATDWDAQPSDMPNIDAYLKGCAEVLGLTRVGIYGGFSVIDHCATAKTADWYWQTSAWEYGRGVHPMATLYQYWYNDWIAGMNCDDTQALAPNYGQDVAFEAQVTPAPDPTPVPPRYPSPDLPNWWKEQKGVVFPVDRHWKGALWVAERRKSQVITPTPQRKAASPNAGSVGPDLPAGTMVDIERVFKAADGADWAVLRSSGKAVEGARIVLSDLSPTPAVP